MQAAAPGPGPPSNALIEVADAIASFAHYPVLDAGCEFGRNAVALASRGMSVICVDRDRRRLRSFINSAQIRNIDRGQSGNGRGRLHPVLADLNNSLWPFSPNCFGAIICVHFLDIGLFEAFHSSLVSGGHLYIETFGGHGGNYLDLPKAGQVRDSLSQHFDLAFYRERIVGPPGFGAVCVKLLGKKL